MPNAETRDREPVGPALQRAVHSGRSRRQAPAVRIIRLAAVSYLNTRPLISVLETGEIPGYQVMADVPSRLPALVEGGEADLGLLPVGYCVERPELALVENVGIACRGPVRSILLLTRQSARECSRIAVTTSSISSVALLSLLLEHWFKSEAELTPAASPVQALERGDADGALLIGDPALQAEEVSGRTYDLGEEWFRLTGLPFIFALWAGPDRAIAEKAAPDLFRAMVQGRADIPRLAAEAAPRLGLPASVCEEYLSHYIIHDIGEAELRGFAAFREMMREREARLEAGNVPDARAGAGR
jgi:chorismate dehydratase